MIFVMLVSLLLPRTVAGRTWHVPAEAPTIQAGIDSAAAGDDVLVAPGTYFEHDIVMKPAIWVHSEQGPAATSVDATADGRGFDCVDLQQNAVIEGFTIRNGRGADYGGGVRCLRSRVVIRDCVFTGCTAGGLGGGIYAYESEIEISSCTVNGCYAVVTGGGICVAYPSTVTITDCKILDNESANAGGIYAGGQEVTIVRCTVSGNVAYWGVAGGILCGSDALTIRDCLITENVAVVIGQGAGLYVAGGSGSVSGCTVAYNLGWYDAVYIEGADIEMDRAIIAFNEGRPFRCWDSRVTVHCCDIYGNTEGDEICGDDLGGNFSEDPLLCDEENGDYTLDAQSPCLPGNHPDGVDCGLIGALGQGCGPTATEERTWGRIKMLFRSDGEKNGP